MGQGAPGIPGPSADSLSDLLGCPGDPAGAEEEQARPERAPHGALEPQILQDTLTFSLAEVPQVSLSLPSNREICPHHPTTAPQQVSGPHHSTATPGLAAPPTTPQHLASFITLSPLCTQPHPTHPSPLGNSKAKRTFLGVTLVFSVWGLREWVRTSLNTLPPPPILKLSQRKGWGLYWVLHELPLWAGSREGGGWDTFLDLPTQAPRTMPQARRGFLAPPSGPPPPVT